jgi:hypothetical protein
MTTEAFPPASRTAACNSHNLPIRHFYQRWGAAIAIERRPSVAARLHAAERALADPDPAIRDQAVREAAEIVQAAYREVAGG